MRLATLIRISFACCVGLAFTHTAFGQSLYADPKARQAGDIVTILLEERTAAQRESAWENSSDAAAGGSAGAAGGTLAGSFGADARFSTDEASRNESIQRDLLRGTISAQVVNVDPAGNLAVEGERRITVNGETHVMTVSGLVRPYDVDYDNTVSSQRIANANIVYVREGGVARSLFKPGALARIGALLILVAAVTVGAS